MQRHENQTKWRKYYRKRTTTRPKTSGYYVGAFEQPDGTLDIRKIYWTSLGSTYKGFFSAGPNDRRELTPTWFSFMPVGHTYKG